MDLIDILTFSAFIALNLDVVLQNYRVYHLKSAVDVSVFGVFLRLFAVAILATKFSLLDQQLLFIGQFALTINVLAYSVLVIRYHKKKKRR